jgi:serine/threonine-protein kinase
MSGSAADIFVSYKAEDRARIKPLVDALEADGFSVWWDAHIGGGSNWRRDIQEHLDAAKCVIVAWTKRSVGPEGEFVRDEAGRAKRRGTYLPVLIDPVEPPLGFGELQALSLKGWKGDRSDSRYLAVVAAVGNRVGGEGSPKQVGSALAASRRAVLAGGIGVGAVAAAGAGGWLLLKPNTADNKRIAVLPFANLSGEPDQAYFSDGVAEELRSALARIGMEVIGRTSSDAVKDMDATAVAARLKVANILTGSVRRSPQMIRVNAQLVSGKDGVERWTQTYDRTPGDAIKIQTDIAENVAQALSIALGQAARAALTLGGTADSIAQDLILQSRKLLRDNNTVEAFRRCIALADAAIARDANYADAYVEKAYGLVSLAVNFSTNPTEVASQLSLANEAANHALAIAPKLGSAHGQLAGIERARLNFAGALEHLQQALALSPDDPEVLTATTIFAWLGHGREALRLADRFMALDPLNPTPYRRKAEELYALRQYAQSVEAGRRAIALGANSNARAWTSSSLLLLGRPRDAVAELSKMPAGDPFRQTGEAVAAARTGDAAGAERLMDRMKKQFGAAGSYQYGQICSQLGQSNRAFAELDQAFTVKDPGLGYLKEDSFMDPIRNDPRFAALVGKLNFS